MCGIVGLSLRASHPNAQPVVDSMAERIRHRGPDSGGYAASANGLAHIGFRRLAIRDLNPRANQPMTSASGKTAIVFNGEVYNTAELAERYLPGMQLRTSGDTEVVLETIERHGLDIVPELNGMFAIAVVDLQSGETTLIRDRMGMKPLYVYQQDGLLAFGSELRTLKPFGLQVDPEMAELFFHFGYCFSPFTFFQHTTQVCPGEIVTLRGGEITKRQRYHRFGDAEWSHQITPLESIEEVLHDSVGLRLLSDVAVGSFLSGGVDSALVASHVSNQSGEAIPTFTVSFRDRGLDESQHAAETASELSLPHHVIEIQEQNLTELFADFFDCYEQPYADPSGLVTMLLCREVKQHVTVALSGDGGDEFFGGYARYSWFRKALTAQQVPGVARKLAAFGLSHLDQKRGKRLARWLTARDPSELYTQIIRNWNATEISEVITGDAANRNRPVDFVRDVFEQVNADPLAGAACFDATYYIPDDLQVKLDRASMQVALEVRCPLLDYRMANAGAALTTTHKYRDGLKTVLKNLLRRRVSPAVLDRPKQGFSVPLGRWLQGQMRPLVEDTLRQQVVRESGWLNTKTACQVQDGFYAGRGHLAHEVWMLFGLASHLKQPAADPMFATLANQSPQTVTGNTAQTTDRAA